MSKPFKLSSVLYGHSLDVRSLSTTPDNSIVSGSRDKTAKFWKSNLFNASYSDYITYKDQKNFVASVLYVPPSVEFPDGFVITGGNDNVILIYKPSEPFATFTIKEHTNTVCALANGVDANTFLSSSWDMTAKSWNLRSLKSATVTFTGHTAAIWSVIQLSNTNVVTACADKSIGIWFKNGQQFRTLSGHTDCVRGVADFPELKNFISVSNDASIKVWSYEGENLDTLYGHTNYIYSIARNESNGPGCFVTSDEDKTVRIWQDGANIQSITLPAQSIWCVACLSNGDIVSGSSDGIIRVFTQDEARYASEETLKNFEDEVNALTKQTCEEIGGYKVSDLPGREALYDPGKKPGQMKMIREAGGVMAYTWVEDGDNSHWEKVGDVVGANEKANEGKTMFEGLAYDYVFTVDVEDGKPPLKLPFNKGDDPYVAANKFLDKNQLPAVYLDQVVEFILKNSQDATSTPMDTSTYVDPFTGASRYTPSTAASGVGQAGANVDPFTGASSYSTSHSRPNTTTSTTSINSGGNADPFTGGSSYTTTVERSYFPQEDYIRFDMGDPKVIGNKLREFNGRVESGRQDDGIMTEIIGLCSGPCAGSSTVEKLFGLLQWPDDLMFPVIDVIRLAVRDKVNNAYMATKDDGALINKLKMCVSKDCKVVNNTLVSLRALSNLFLHTEGEQLVYLHRMELLECITSLSPSNKNIEIALSTFLLNLTILTIRNQDEVGVVLLAGVLSDILINLNDPEAQFRAFVALGTLLSKSPNQRMELKVRVVENSAFMGRIRELAAISGNDLEVKRMRCAQQVHNLLQ